MVCLARWTVGKSFHTCQRSSTIPGHLPLVSTRQNGQLSAKYFSNSVTRMLASGVKKLGSDDIAGAFYCRTTTGSSTGSFTTTGTRNQTGASGNWDSEEDGDEGDGQQPQRRPQAARQGRSTSHWAEVHQARSSQGKPVVLPRKSVSFEDEWEEESERSNWDDTR